MVYSLENAREITLGYGFEGYTMYNRIIDQLHWR